jgi:peroxisome-assembly ATPase
VVVAAAAPPAELFANIVTQAEAHSREKARSTPGCERESSKLVVDDNLGFVRERTVSRLTEMGSLEYLQVRGVGTCVCGVCIV